MYQRLDTCPSCKSHKIVNEKIVKDYSISQESFALSRCNSCNLLFTNPRPSVEEIGKYYQSEDYISHTNKANSLINIIYKLVRNYTLNSKYQLIRKYHDSGTLLDYGCGTGTFLHKMHKNGFQCKGIEPDNNARQLAIKTGNEIYHDINDVDKKLKYDVITGWHVFEHVHDPREVLKQIKKRMTDKGTVFLAMPNHKSYDAAKYQEYWAGYDVPRHLLHFTRDSFTALVKSRKLKVIDIIPMYFDSFYVSLLSTKYKYGSSRYVEAFRVGYQSNKRARINKEYSSLIYVIKK